MCVESTKVTYQTIFSDEANVFEFNNKIYAEWFFEDLLKNKLVRNVRINYINDANKEK